MSSADDWVNDSSAHESPAWTCDECRHCGESSPEEQRLLLWDGHAYCQTCIGATSPELLAYATSHQTIQETLPLSAWMPFKRTFAVGYIGCTAVFTPLLFLGAWRVGGLRDAFVAVLWLQGPIVAIGVFLATASALQFRLHRPSVRIRNGEMLLQAGKKR